MWVKRNNEDDRKTLIWSILSSFGLLFLLLGWIKEGFILGTAEEGITFYNVGRTVNIIGNVWINSGLGSASPFFTSRLPFYYLTSIFEKLGLSNWNIQAGMFYFTLIIPLIYIPKLVEVIKGSKSVGYIAALFYLFNFFTVSQIFHRFIILFIFVWSLLPVFLYYWVKWVKEGRYKDLFFFQLVSLIYSYAFGLPSSSIVLWTPPFLYSAYLLMKKRDIKVVKRTLFGVFLWTIMNIWWMYPMFGLRNNNFAEMLNSNSNLNSLVEVSKYYDNKDILNLTQKFYFERDGYFKTFYSERVVNFASKGATLFLFVGIGFALLRKKLGYFLILLFVGWFISKGANPPFGNEFYKFMFENFSFFQVLRNPYEKFGVVFLLPYSVLTAYGIYCFSTLILNKKMGSMFAFIVIGLITITIGRPVLNGDVFFDYYYVKVPEYYEKANSIIKNTGEGKILHLPYRSVPNIQYTWGFRGEDTSIYLFDNPSISGINSLRSEYEYLSRMPPYFSNKNFSKLLNTLNVDFVVVHNDLEYDPSYYNEASSAEKDVQKWDGVSHLGEEGNLNVFKLDNLNIQGEINVFGSVKNVETLNDFFEYANSDDFNPIEEAVCVNAQNIDFPKTLSDKSNKPDTEVKKISNQKYKVTVKNAGSPYILVLNHSFNQNWIARSGEDTFDAKFIANGYANGWVIDKKGNYTINVVFKVWLWE